MSLLLAAGSVSAESALTLEGLMHGMASSRGVAASFREVKEMRLLSVPVESEGVLYFVPPDRMARHTTSPGRSSLVLDGDRLLLADAAGGDEIDLSANPAARLFVDNFTVLFAGDLDELRRRYEPTFEAGPEHWTLRLVPRRAPVKDLIAHVTLRGDGTALREMEMLEVDGDRTRTVFTQVELDRPFSEAELRELFDTSLPAP